MKVLNTIISLFVFTSTPILVCSHLPLDLIEERYLLLSQLAKKEISPSPPPLRLEEDKRVPHNDEYSRYQENLLAISKTQQIINDARDAALQLASMSRAREEHHMPEKKQKLEDSPALYTDNELSSLADADYYALLNEQPMSPENNQKEYKFSLLDEFPTYTGPTWKVVELHFLCNPECTLIPYKKNEIRTHALKQRSHFEIEISNAKELNLIHETLLLEQIDKRGPFSIFECKKTQDYFLQVDRNSQKSTGRSAFKIENIKIIGHPINN